LDHQQSNKKKLSAGYLESLMMDLDEFGLNKKPW